MNLLIQREVGPLGFSKSQQYSSSKIFSQSLTSGCDQNIIQQLSQQNIQFDCLSSEIKIQNQNKVEFSLKLQKEYISSSIIIEDVSYLKINQLIIDSIQLNNKSTFIKIHRIQQIQIDQLFVYDLASNEQNKFILFSQDIAQFNINEIQIDNQINRKQQLKYFILTSEILEIENIQVQTLSDYILQLNGKEQMKIGIISFIDSKQNNNIISYFDNHQFTSSKKIIVHQIHIQINVLESQNQKLIDFIICNQQVQQASINIGEITYQANQTSSYHVTDLVFLDQFQKPDIQKYIVNIGQISYKQYSIKSYLRIKLHQIYECNIGRVQIYNQKNNQGQIDAFFNFFEVERFKIKQIQFQQNSKIDGKIFLGKVNYFEIEEVVIDPHTQFLSDVIQLQNCKHILINKLIAENINNYYYKIQGFQNQSSLFQITDTLMLSQLGNYFFTISNVFADLENYQNLQFILSDQVFQELIIENSVFLNGSSVTFGGCMQFVVSEFGAISKIYLTNTTFGSCQSRFLGGAVYGVQLIKAQNSKIFNCESRIGGGLYLYDYVDVQELSNIQFKNNRGLLLNDNYSSQIQKFIIEEAIEIFSKDKEANLFSSLLIPLQINFLIPLVFVKYFKN
ncbi:hypothetical protein ABPG74_013690 [Tetrahymena malaccensis]